MPAPVSMSAVLFALLLLAPAPEAEKCVVEGQVVRAASSEPLRKAHLTLISTDPRMTSAPPAATTAEDGRFCLKNVEPGRYRLWIERNGYVRQDYGSQGPNRPGTTLTIERNQTIRDITFRLVPAAVISGRVLDEDGDPVPNVRVQLMRQAYVDGKRQMVPGAGSSTNDLGEHRIHGLAPGRYFLNAAWMPAMLFGVSGIGVVRGETTDQSYAPTYFPGTTDPSQAAPLDAGPGVELRGMDIRLSRVATVRVRGKVLNAVTGRPGVGAMVSTIRRGAFGPDGFGPDRSFHAVNDPQGIFELRGVTPASYTIIANWSDGHQQYIGTQQVDVGNSDVEGVYIVISAGLDITGRVRFEGNAGPAGSVVRVGLEPQERGTPFAGGGVAGVKDGAFLIRNVHPGKYRVWVSSADDFYLKSARFAGADVLDSGLDLTAGAGVLELILSPAPATVEGVVSNDQGHPATGAQVVLVPDSRRRTQSRLFKIANTDQNGRFNLRGIPPGEYKLFGWEGIEPGAYMDPEFLKPFEGRGESVSLREGGRETVRLKLITAQ